MTRELAPNHARTIDDLIKMFEARIDVEEWVAFSEPTTNGGRNFTKKQRADALTKSIEWREAARIAREYKAYSESMKT